MPFDSNGVAIAVQWVCYSSMYIFCLLRAFANDTMFAISLLSVFHIQVIRRYFAGTSRQQAQHPTWW